MTPLVVKFMGPIVKIQLLQKNNVLPFVMADSPVSASATGDTTDDPHPDTSTSSKAKKRTASRPRRNNEQMAEDCAADLERLQSTDTKDWPEKKIEAHTRAIEDLSSKLKHYQASLEKKSMKRAKSVAVSYKEVFESS